MLLEALSAGTITCLAWREERHLTASWSLNTDLGRLWTQYLSLRIRPCTRDLIDLTQSDKDSNSGSWSTSLFIHLLALFLTASIIILKLCFQLMCWGSLNLGPWEITFRRLSCWMIFRSPVITYPDGLYWKGEWEQSQVRGFLRDYHIFYWYFPTKV
jgi:hypothetical protein